MQQVIDVFGSHRGGNRYPNRVLSNYDFDPDLDFDPPRPLWIRLFRVWVS